MLLGKINATMSENFIRKCKPCQYLVNLFWTLASLNSLCNKSEEFLFLRESISLHTICEHLFVQNWLLYIETSELFAFSCWYFDQKILKSFGGFNPKRKISIYFLENSNPMDDVWPTADVKKWQHTICLWVWPLPLSMQCYCLNLLPFFLNVKNLWSVKKAANSRNILLYYTNMPYSKICTLLSAIILPELHACWGRFLWPIVHEYAVLVLGSEKRQFSGPPAAWLWWLFEDRDVSHQLRRLHHLQKKL